MSGVTDRLEVIVRILATSVGREVGSSGHEAARRALLSEMAAVNLAGYAGEGFEHRFSREGVDFCNLLGVLEGSRPELEPILLAAPCSFNPSL